MQRIQKAVLLLETMKTISKIFILLIPFYIEANEVLVKKFEILNNNQPISFVNSRASSLANQVIRDHAYLIFIDPKKDSNFYSSCWKKFIINRKINIDVTENVYGLIKKTRSSYFYEVYLQPSKIKVRGVSSNTFKTFCQTSFAS